MDDAEDEMLDTREAYCSTSPWFGAMLCPAVEVRKDDDDGRSDSEPEVD